MEIEDIIICRYEVGIIINDNRNIIIATNDKDTAIKYYIINRDKYINNNNHVIVFIYDYDKNTNIEFFDNEVDIL